MSAPLPSVLAFALMLGAALGGGAALLRAIRIDRDLETGERTAWAFVLGIGILGWLGFFLALFGWIQPLALAAACIVLTPGVMFLGLRPGDGRFDGSLGRVTWGLIAVLAAILLFDVLEGLSPPSDADSLAYHFATPKQFLAAGHLLFVPRAVEGAVPMLQQMTYMIAMGMGGERAMTLWTMASGWGVGFLLYCVARPYLGRDWSLAATVLFLTAPVVVYAAGSGQVEPRNAAFALLAAAATARALRTGALKWALAAGIAAGFFAASKYPGLLFVAACGLFLMPQRRWFAHGLVYTLGVVIVGTQWYAWNAWNVGDPVFPMLYGMLPYDPGVPWNSAQQHYFKTGFAGPEKPFPATLVEWFVYPFRATLWPHPAFEALRAGFGVGVLLLLPATLLGAMVRGGERILRSPTAVFLGIAIVFYALWFFLGPSERIRHLLPVYPLLLIAVLAATRSCFDSFSWSRAPLAASIAFVLAFQTTGTGLFGATFAHHMFTGESREAYYERLVMGADAAFWIDRHPPESGKVFLQIRQIIYLLDVPTFYATPLYDARIDLRPDSKDPQRFWRQLIANDVSHLLVAGDPTAEPTDTGGANYLVHRIAAAGCLRPVRRFETTAIASRTIPGLYRDRLWLNYFALSPRTCKFADGVSAAPPEGPPRAGIRLFAATNHS